MDKSKLHGNKLQLFISAGILVATLLTMFSPDVYLFKALNNKAVLILFLLIGLMLSSLMVSWKLVMYSSLIAAASLAYFLKERTHSQLSVCPQPIELPSNPPVSQSNFIKIAQFNAQDLGADSDATLDIIGNIGADVIFVQELTPLWEEKLITHLNTSHPYNQAFVRIDIHGMAILSSRPFASLDTFMFEGIPNLIGSINGTDSAEPFHFVCTHITPPLNQKGLHLMTEHLSLIAEKVRSIGAPVLAIGNFNSVAWSQELQSFRKESKMEDSRETGFGPYATAAAMLSTPVNYIFHSNNLECLSFGNINDNNANEVGIFGVYKLSTSDTEG